jgi:hypothetical protein
MAVQKENLAARVQKSYKILSAVATDLNKSSDRLGESLAALDAALRKLNLGVSTWVHFHEWHSEDRYSYYFEEIGYVKIGGKWGIAIRTVDGDENHDTDKVDAWSFNEAPRALRVRAIAKVPELLDKLIQDASVMITTINEQVEMVDLLAAAMTDIEGDNRISPGNLVAALNIEVAKASAPVIMARGSARPPRSNP